MRRLFLSAIAIAAFIGSTAGAQATMPLPTYNLERLVLNPDGDGSLFVAMGQGATEGSSRFSLLGDYADSVRETRTGQTKIPRFLLHGTFTYAVLNWLELGVQVPVIAYQGPANSAARHIAAPETGGLGTPIATARFTFMRQSDGSPISLALDVGIGLPIGTTSALGRDDRVSILPRLSASRDFGGIRVGGEFHTWFRSQENFYYRGISGNPLDTQDHEVGGGLAVSGEIVKNLRGELNLLGNFAVTNPDASIDLYAALRYAFSPKIEAYIAGGPEFGRLSGTAAFRIFLGAAFGGTSGGTTTVVQPAKAVCDAATAHRPGDCPELDDDKDGIANGADACPLLAEDKDGFQDSDGCPDPDNDGDGTLDTQDKCKDEAGPASNGGCPLKDADNDGITDDKDQCPAEAGPADNHGCPPKDTDKDGVLDDQDKCPTQAGPASNGGCPVTDADNDGIPDTRDNCPNEKGDAKNAGCPAKKKQLVVITDNKLEITGKVYFANGKATILAKSYKLLNNVADVLNDHPNIEKVWIDGFTDDRGGGDANVALSQTRAQAVVEYLVSKGVKPERMTATGFGSACPLSSNATSTGRESNRRVEFNISESTRCTQQPSHSEAPAPTGSSATTATGAAATTAAPTPTPLTDSSAATPAPKKSSKKKKSSKAETSPGAAAATTSTTTTTTTKTTPAAKAAPAAAPEEGQRWTDVNATDDAAKAAAAKNGKKKKGTKAPTQVK